MSKPIYNGIAIAIMVATLVLLCFHYQSKLIERQEYDRLFKALDRLEQSLQLIEAKIAEMQTIPSQEIPLD